MRSKFIHTNISHHAMPTAKKKTAKKPVKKAKKPVKKAVKKVARKKK